jgi:hypothetical protein
MYACTFLLILLLFHTGRRPPLKKVLGVFCASGMPAGGGVGTPLSPIK